ncbi:MAG: D-Ala-D-Ala carboxypeptidase family metallohydrolase [Candidatus Aenigmatarchaeota archaeon]
MLKSKYFKIEELVDKATFEKFGENAWWMISEKAIIMLDNFREFIGRPVIVNNWKTGGQYQYSGFRPRNCETGAEYSQHRFGRAFDIKITGMTSQEIYKKILENKEHPLLKNITAIEDISLTPTWVHIDCRNCDRIMIVKI